MKFDKIKLRKRTWVLMFITFVAAIVSLVATVSLTVMMITENAPSLPAHFGTCPLKLSHFPVLVISLNGFRAHDIKRGITKTLREMMIKGSSAPFMAPSFPFRNYPNIITMMTGLYPESHGIFSYKDYKTKTLGGEPIWITAKKKNLKTASYMWLKSKPFEENLKEYSVIDDQPEVPTAADKVMEWLEGARQERPSLFLLNITHRVESEELEDDDHLEEDDVTRNLKEDELVIESLVQKLRETGLISCVNFIIVSGPELPFRIKDKSIYLDKIIPNDWRPKVNFSFGSYGAIALKSEYKNLKSDFESTLSCKTSSSFMFLKKNLPKRLHYSENLSPGDYVFLPRDNDLFMELDPKSKREDILNYDLPVPKHGLFVAYGPSFKEKFEVKSFQNIELYNLICRLLNITPAPNNGTEGLLDVMLVNPPPFANTTVTTPNIYDEEDAWRNNYLGSKCERIPFQPLRNLLSMNDVVKSKIAKQALPWGYPQQEISGDLYNKILFQPDHITGYSSAQRMASWISFTLHKMTSVQVKSSTNTWISDIRLNNDEIQSCDRSSKSLGYPLFQPEFSLNDTYSHLSFLISNVVPFSKHLASHWKGLMLNLIPKWLKASNSHLNVIVGPVFDPDSLGRRGRLNLNKNPTHYFAIVTRCTHIAEDLNHCDEGYIESQAFIYPQNLLGYHCFNSTYEFASLFRAKIRDVEELTRLKFFPQLKYARRLELITKEYFGLWKVDYHE